MRDRNHRYLGTNMMRTAIVLLLAAALGACATVPTAPQAVVAELAPGGKLRAAINFGNPILAKKDAASGEASGVSVDLALELGRRLGVPVELVTFTAAGKVADAARANVWDVAFVAIDPVRGKDMDYSAAYVVIEGAYLVRQDSPIRANAEVDVKGKRIVVARGSAYDLYLSRELKNAQLVRVPTSPEVTNAMLAQNMEVAAGVKQQLEADAKRVSGVRLLDGRFMVINQAMAMQKGRPAGQRYLAGFVEEMKASGFVADGLKRSNQPDAAVAPAAAAN
jgi:polar amino acid transport system substrate-binding protein